MSLRVVARTLVLCALLGAALPPAAHAVSVPNGFAVDNAVPGVTFTTPTAMAFLPDGAFLVCEAAGEVWMVRNGAKLPTPVWSAEAEVIANGDRGLLGVAVDPDYAHTRMVYFLYTVDPDSNGVEDNPHVFGRVTRYRMRAVGDTDTVDPASRTILLGVDWSHGILDASTSHSVGSLRFGRDGSLFVSHGDGGDYNATDAGGLHPNAFGPGRTDPNQDIGAFRAQDITSLNGKILRINPANGHGYASNPFSDSDLTSNRSRVWAYGLRNPFRFTVRPGTGSTDTTAANPGTLVIGDVGWTTWEEIDVAAAGGRNFGWPCREGFHAVPSYQAANPAHNGCGSTGTATNPSPWSAPVADWHHSDPQLSSPPGVTGIAGVGGVFYTDSLYPAEYRGRYFFADYGAGWIRVATFGANQTLISTADFATDMDAPVDIERSPATGDLYYVSIATGEVRHIRSTGVAGGDAPPVALAAASPAAGLVPLTVTLSAADSFDPESDPLTYSWDFGDGAMSTLASPTHVYTSTGSYVVTLTVRDGRGGESQSQTHVLVGSTATFPTTHVLDTFDQPNGPLAPTWTATPAIEDQNDQLLVTGTSATTVWSAAAYGADQECYATFDSIPGEPIEIDLLLKLQGLAVSDGDLEAWYDPTGQRVVISTYDPDAGWRTWGEVPGVVFAPGDQYGARAFSNGIVSVYKNHVEIGEVSVLGWPFVALGGHIGITMEGALGVALDDFGGGDWQPVSASPTVTVTSPNGGEAWVGGSSHPITWTATDDVGVTGVDVYYRDRATTPWTPLALNATNTGSFTWYVHDTPGTGVKVRVVAHDADGNAGVDSSDAVFTIEPTPGGFVHTTLRDFQMPGTQPLEAGTFTDQNTCYTCHGGYNAPVEPGRNFRGAMMSQAARDPLFYACLAIAEQDAPASGDLCIRCHAPFSWLSGKSQPTSGAQIDTQGRDGVSCDLCHRLVDPTYAAGVSPPEDQTILAGMLPAHRPTSTANGQYVVDSQSRRRGPFTDPVTPHPFLASPFHTKSELCGTCHDVSNPVFRRVGDARYAAGPLDTPADTVDSAVLMPLERTFSEWRNSAFPAGVTLPDFAGNAPGGVVSSCQDCHLRAVTGTGCKSSDAPVRTNLPLHDMMGGNAWMGGVIADLYPGETDPAALSDGAARAVGMLQKAATLELTTTAEGDSARATVKVTNRTGHKLPTGYPEGRRAWINVQARDANGQLVYESCAYDTSTGVLTLDPRSRVYEAHLGLSPGLAGATGLPAGASFHFTLNDTLYKDNRIPPLGFTNAAFAAFGGAPVDPTQPGPRYADGQNWDAASYPLPPSAVSVSATLYYQSSSKEYVDFLLAANSTNAAGQALHDAWASHRRSPPVAMATQSTSARTLDAPAVTAPRAVALAPARNPFHGPLELALALPRPATVRLEIVDVAGRLVAAPPATLLPAGDHRLVWDGRGTSGHDAGPGVFWAIVRVDGERLSRRVVRLR